jgi:hypothetical protein
MDLEPVMRSARMSVIQAIRRRDWYMHVVTEVCDRARLIWEVAKGSNESSACNARAFIGAGGC